MSEGKTSGELVNVLLQEIAGGNVGATQGAEFFEAQVPVTPFFSSWSFVDGMLNCCMVNALPSENYVGLLFDLCIFSYIYHRHIIICTAEISIDDDDDDGNDGNKEDDENDDEANNHNHNDKKIMIIIIMTMILMITKIMMMMMIIILIKLMINDDNKYNKILAVCGE